MRTWQLKRLFARRAVLLLLSAATLSLSLSSSFCAPVMAQPKHSTVKFAIKVDQPAYTGMPVWVRAQSTSPRPSHYPYSSDAGEFGNNRIEVKYAGKVLTRREFPGLNISCETGPRDPGDVDSYYGPSDAPKNLLPLHCAYKFDKPGVYSVRWAKLRKYYKKDGTSGEEAVAQSDWHSFTVEPSTASRREAWLKDKLAHVPADEGKLLTDYLPSLLVAAPDPRVLNLLISQVYAQAHPKGCTAVPAEGVVGDFAGSAIPRFSEADIREAVLKAIHERGPIDYLAYFISYYRPFFQADKEKLVAETVPYLHSKNTTVARDALIALGFLHGSNYFKWPVNSTALSACDRAVMDAAPDLIKRDMAHQLAQYLGTVSTDKARARALLWQIVDVPDSGKGAENFSQVYTENPGGGRQQAIICLTWIGDKQDLPRLGKLLLTMRKSDKDGNDLSMLPYQLDKRFGVQAAPYLKKASTESPYSSVRSACVETLKKVKSL